MSKILIDNGDSTQVVITLSLPMAEIATVFPLVAAKLGYASVDSALVSPEQFIEQQTRQWWFDKYTEALEEIKEVAAAESAQQKRDEIDAMISSGKLLGL